MSSPKPACNPEACVRSTLGCVHEFLAPRIYRPLDSAAILVEDVAGMPGCLSYVVARDATDPDAIWITEVWHSRKCRQASLALPSVQPAIAKGRPFIAGFGERFETKPIGGHGLGAHG